jgi:hypothetical protein
VADIEAAPNIVGSLHASEPCGYMAMGMSIDIRQFRRRRQQ